MAVGVPNLLASFRKIWDRQSQIIAGTIYFTVGFQRGIFLQLN
jgi:hypothetical protein